MNQTTKTEIAKTQYDAVKEDDLDNNSKLSKTSALGGKRGGESKRMLTLQPSKEKKDRLSESRKKKEGSW